MKLSKALYVIIPLLSACGDGDYEDKERKLVDFVSEQKFGNGSDYWIVKGAAFGGPVKVGLIFGYGDDYSVCTEIVDAMNKIEPRANFYCLAAN